MTDTGYLGIPIKELTRDELIEALGVLGEMYQRMVNLCHDQCEATNEMIEMAHRRQEAAGDD